MFTSRQIESLLQGINKERLVMAIENWDEDLNKGKIMLIASIADAENPLIQLMNIWAEVFYHQNPNEFIELMVKNGIDGISITKNKDEVYYVIYNKEVLQ